jgi:hypothetical protein
VRFARLVDRRVRALGRAFGPRRLRGNWGCLGATLGGGAGVPAVQIAQRRQCKRSPVAAPPRVLSGRKSDAHSVAWCMTRGPGNRAWDAAIRPRTQDGRSLPKMPSAWRRVSRSSARANTPTPPPIARAIRRQDRHRPRRGGWVHRGRLTKPATPTCAPSWSSRLVLPASPVGWRQIASRQQGLDPRVIGRAWAAQQRRHDVLRQRSFAGRSPAARNVGGN